MPAILRSKISLQQIFLNYLLNISPMTTPAKIKSLRGFCKQHERTWMFTLMIEVIWEFLNEEMMLDFSIINLCKISVVIHSNFSKQTEMTCQ